MFKRQNKENYIEEDDLSELHEQYKSLLIKNNQTEYENINLKGTVDKLSLEIENLKELNSMEEIKKLNDKICELKTENENKDSKIKSLETKLNNDENMTNLKYEVKEKSAEIESLKKTLKYKEELIDNLRSLPDVQAMITNLQKLSVPGLEELHKFANIVKDSPITEINNRLDALTKYIEANSRYSPYRL